MQHGKGEGTDQDRGDRGQPCRQTHHKVTACQDFFLSALNNKPEEEKKKHGEACFAIQPVERDGAGGDKRQVHRTEKDESDGYSLQIMYPCVFTDKSH